MNLRSLTRAQRAEYDATVQGSHHRRLEVAVFRRSDGKLLSSFPMPEVLGGGLNGDASRTPIEIAEVRVLDTERVLQWSHGEHRRYRIQVTDSRFVPALDDWVDEVGFTGPLWDFEREDGVVVKLIAQGAERDAMGSVRRVYDKPRKTPVHRVVRDLLSSAGAKPSQLLIPRTKGKLPEAVTVGVRRGKDINPKKKGKQQRKRQVFKANREDHYWGAAEPCADADDRDLFADNLGRFVMRRRKGRPSATLPASVLLSAVKERRGDDGEVPNTWHVYGRNPAGRRPQVHVKVSLQDRFESSAHALRWNQAPREVIVTIRNKKIPNNKKARQIGARHRDRARREPVEREVELLPVAAYVRPWSRWTVPTPAGRVSVTAQRWHVPWGPDAAPFTLGATRQVGQ